MVELFDMEYMKGVALSVCVSCMVLVFGLMTPALAGPHDLNVVNGKWARTDGDYTLLVRDAASGGSADVRYFNPGKIHVEESHASIHKGLVRLFVKLRDKGYPGSTYTLYYYEEKDALAGFYYQAAMGRTYKVIFLRENGI